MKRYNIYARVVGSKYIGTVDANSPEEAEEKAWKLDECHISLCNQCSSDCEDPEIESLVIEEDN